MSNEERSVGVEIGVELDTAHLISYKRLHEVQISRFTCLIEHVLQMTVLLLVWLFCFWWMYCLFPNKYKFSWTG
jgi:uncharacterized BrkB/YihY/UPF0761 family membrane protein